MVGDSLRIMSFGEVLWDVYPDYQKLGGAPFNFAAHCSLLGAKVTMISSVGNDDMGHEILDLADKLNIETKLITIQDELPTGIVNVTLDTNGKPTYEIKQGAWDLIKVSIHDLEERQFQDLLVFGTLAMRSTENHETLKSLCKFSNLILLDLNIRLNFYNKALIDELLQLTDILKLNDEELILLSSLYDVRVDAIYSYLSNRFSLKLIITTKGEAGAEAYENGKMHYASGIKIKVVDTVASGDAFLAAFACHYLKNHSISNCLEEGCKLGAYVATQSGAIPQKIFSNIK